MKDLVPVANSIPKVVLTPQDKKNIDIILNFNLPMQPEDATKLYDYSIFVKNKAKVIKDIAKHYLLQRLNPMIYNMALDRAIECGELVLRAELTLSTYLKQIKTRKGMRTDLSEKENKKIEKRIKDQYKTKTQIIKDEYGLTKQQAKDISMLEEWAVEKAIAQGRQNREIPTRTMAIRMIKEKIKEENNKPYNPDAKYMDHVLYPSEVMSLPPIRSTTLCSNVGIGEFFLEYAHVKNVIAAEFEADRVEFYKTNYPNVKIFKGDLFDKNIQKQVIDEHIAQGCKLIIATPPCQTVSLAGKRDFNDPRTKLFLPILNIIEAVDSVNDYVLVENVPPYMTASPKGLQYILEGKTIAEYIKFRLEKLGYEVNIDKLNGANYGTAQSRERMIILASKKGMWKFPLPFKKQITLMEAIGDLPSISPKMNYDKYYSTPTLTKEEIDMLRHTPTGKSAWDNAKEYQPKNKDGSKSGSDRKGRFKRESWDKPASTITSDCGSISGMSTIHPGRPVVDKEGNITWSDPRVYNLEEKLILLGLSIDKRWCNNKPCFQIPDWASDKLINDVLAESFLPRLAAVLAETIPNRTAHPDEKLEDYPQIITPKPNEFLFYNMYKGRIFYPVVEERLRNYDLNTEYDKQQYINKIKMLVHKKLEEVGLKMNGNLTSFDI